MLGMSRFTFFFKFYAFIFRFYHLGSVDPICAIFPEVVRCLGINSVLESGLPTQAEKIINENIKLKKM
jgi:hypothetical protein